MERFAHLAALALNQVLPSPVQSTELETPPDPKLGDLGYPCFKLSKELRKAPPQIAHQIVADLTAKNALPPGLTAAPVGPYVNFTVDRPLLLRSLLEDILRIDTQGRTLYGRLPEKSREKWVLEFSAPNVAKPMNIYHLRGTALGAALDRVGRYRGLDVVSINHLGDWGKQYGMLAVGFKRYAATLPADPSIDDLVKLYVKINQDSESDPTIEVEARAGFLKLEKGDPEMTAVWQKCVDISMKEFNRIYKRLNVHFDHVWGESFYKDQLQPLIADLKKRGILVESEGAWVVPVTDEQARELPPCILEKRDGATIYATRDLAAALYRYDKFRFDRMTYIVGGEQKLHFQQVFAVLRKMGLAWASRCEHVPTGLYRFKDAKMSTRKGNYVTLEDVLTLAKERVNELMKERLAKTDSPTSAAVATDEITEAIAIGAVIFHDLHSDPVKDLEFDVERVVDFDGETGPYLQYAHTRCLSILRKARETGVWNGESLYNPSVVVELKKDEEVALVKILGQFPMQLERTLKFAKASHLAHYLIDVTQAFGVFYRECHVLNESPTLTHARLMLVESTRQILSQGLTLMGIPLPERM